MKVIKYLIYGLVVALAFPSCEDFLEVESESAFEPSYIFSSTTDTKKAVLGIYSLFAKDDYTSRMSCVWMQNTDVEVIAPGAIPDGSRRDIWSLQAGLLSGWSEIYQRWNNCYLAIDRANQCIEGIKASSISGKEEMKMMMAESYCLRAYYYYLLCNFWGDVPYFRESAKAGMNLDRPKTDKNIIYSGCIQDLVDCEEDMLFADEFSDGIERMNREYALGMIAKLALFRAGYGMTKQGLMKRADEYLDVANNDSLAVIYTDLGGVKKTARTSNDYFQLAKDYCQKLIELKDRSLNPDFGQIFKNQCQWIKPVNDDILYEVAFGNVNGGGDVGWCIGVPVTGGTYGTTTIQVNLSPAYYFSFDDDDTRRDVTFSRISYTSNTDQDVCGITGLPTGKWNRLWLKTSPGEKSSKGTGINWPLMRYSEVLLMLAEAENELNGPTSLASESLAKVRRRAFPSEKHSEKVDSYIAGLASKEDFFEAVVNERAWEFGGECIRRFDLVRWNKFGEKIVETKNTIDNIGKAALALELENPEVAQFANFADVLYYQKSNGTIIYWNTKYKIEDVSQFIDNHINELIVVDGVVTYYTQNWAKSLYKKITNEENGEISYSSADYTTRCWRGYTDALGTSAVPYLLPISTSTIGASEVLNNDGYGHVF